MGWQIAFNEDQAAWSVSQPTKTGTVFYLHPDGIARPRPGYFPTQEDAENAVKNYWEFFQ